MEKVRSGSGAVRERFGRAAVGAADEPAPDILIVIVYAALIIPYHNPLANLILGKKSLRNSNNLKVRSKTTVGIVCKCVWAVNLFKILIFVIGNMCKCILVDTKSNYQRKSFK